MREWKRGTSHRPRSKRCPETDAQAPRLLPVSQRKRTRSRKRASSHAPRHCQINGLAPRATAMLVTQPAPGYNGFSWDIVGLHGITWIHGLFRRAFVPLQPSPAVSDAVDKSVTKR